LGARHQCPEKDQVEARVLEKGLKSVPADAPGWVAGFIPKGINEIDDCIEQNPAYCLPLIFYKTGRWLKSIHPQKFAKF